VKFTKHDSLPQCGCCRTVAFLEASRCHGAVCWTPWKIASNHPV